jgi:hypothetical protein
MWKNKNWISSQENEKDDLVRQTTTNLPQNSDNDEKYEEEEDESKALLLQNQSRVPVIRIGYKP